MMGLRFSISFLLLTSIVSAQKYTPTELGSKVYFVIKNFGLKTNGSFSGLKGNIVFDPTMLNTSSFNMLINAASINTDNNLRDKHLRKEEYLHVEKYPHISFSSTKITNSNSSSKFYIFGNLTLKNITKPIDFAFTATPSSTGYHFKGEFDINRRAFGVGGNSLSLSENLKVIIDMNTNK